MIMTCNEGIAFGMILPRWILFVCIGFSFFVFMKVFWSTVRYRQRVRAAAIGVLMAGAFSNAFERVMFGCVMDYWHPVAFFPWFNAADVLIVCGACVAGYEFALTPEKRVRFVKNFRKIS
jgi:signal peptidase II